MKSQQQAEREEQQRIKNLVLNYELNDGDDQDGDPLLPPLAQNMNIHDDQAGIEKPNSPHARLDKSGNNRSGQRARKLQLSDVDWYDRTSHNQTPSCPGAQPTQPSLLASQQVKAMAAKLGGRRVSSFNSVADHEYTC